MTKTLSEAKEIVSNERNTPKVFNPKLNDIIGIISIPKLEKDLPIIVGTDDEQLNKGVGHYIGTKYPGENGQILLSGHRDTVFRGLGNLLHGDEIKLDVEYGSFSYEIVNTYIVDADDTTVINFDLDEEVLVLSTCYPFQYVGDAPQRYIIEAKPRNK
ncbi:class D sortase [Anaerobacillus sp. CMMVII]|uniref:class D sortase n=1 Tax=Anaerobacillus sp. CMMVII TaxID=2755588 RepID=UPI0028E0A391|nr:class D sortase [Anaerobacillus sp. CMMVII]